MLCSVTEMQPIVEVQKVAKVYGAPGAGFEALRAIDLDVRPQEFLSIVGPSGCGKSTLLKCIAGLEAVTGGAIKVRGEQVVGPPSAMGIVFQRDLLLDWRTVLENVLIISEFRGTRVAELEKKAAELLVRFGLGDFQNRFPWELSGGMRQRAAICRAILDNPELLLMDEPFGALDAMTRDDLNLELARLWQETRKTVVFITHGIQEAVFLSDRVAMMARNPGRIVDVFDIDLPRPRTLEMRDSPEFAAIVHRIRDRFADIGAIRKE
jgi:NitT/TauT family transport system ATP-binding protein